MQVKIECQICEGNLAKFICSVCGRNVCGQHFIKTKAVCTDCNIKKVK